MICSHCEGTGQLPALIAGDLRPCPYCDGTGGGVDKTSHEEGITMEPLIIDPCACGNTDPSMFVRREDAVVCLDCGARQPIEAEVDSERVQ